MLYNINSLGSNLGDILQFWLTLQHASATNVFCVS